MLQRVRRGNCRMLPLQRAFEALLRSDCMFDRDGTCRRWRRRSPQWPRRDCESPASRTTRRKSAGCTSHPCIASRIRRRVVADEIGGENRKSEVRTRTNSEWGEAHDGRELRGREIASANDCAEKFRRCGCETCEQAIVGAARAATATPRLRRNCGVAVAARAAPTARHRKQRGNKAALPARDDAAKKSPGRSRGWVASQHAATRPHGRDQKVMLQLLM